LPRLALGRREDVAHGDGKAGQHRVTLVVLPEDTVSGRRPSPDFGGQPGRGVRGDQPFRGAPNFAVAILSPDDRMSDALEKVRLYLENGVRLVWLIDPRARTVLVWSVWGSPRQFAENDMRDGGDMLPGFTVRVAGILPSRDFAEA
jgi:Uma2 family endonuclease